MVKKVKTYLNHMEIIDDEDRLLDLANQHEPGSIWFSTENFLTNEIEEQKIHRKKSFEFFRIEIARPVEKTFNRSFTNKFSKREEF